MSLCECGCGNETTIFKGKSRRFIKGHAGKNIPKSEEHKRKLAESHTGKFLSEDHKQKIKDNHFDTSGENNGMFGKIPHNKGIPMPKEQKEKLRGLKRTKETCDKISGSKKGKSQPSGKNAHNYKGGRKLADARHKASRRGLGHIFLNDCEFDGWVGHHIDYNYVIFCPLEVHLSVLGHSVIKDRKMDEINTKVYEWFVGYYLGK